MNNNKYLSTTECAKTTGIKARTISELCADGEIDAIKESGRWLVNIESLKKYKDTHRDRIKTPKHTGDFASVFGDVSLNYDEVMKPIQSYNNPYEIFNRYKYEFSNQYFITNKGEIYSSVSGKYLKKDIKSTYYYINLPNRKTNRDEHIYIHSLVAYFFCHNRYCKMYVHHIDGNPLNNDAKNLIYVTDAEHKKCHSLLRSYKITKNKKYKEKYRKYISEIKKDNKEPKYKGVKHLEDTFIYA